MAETYTVNFYGNEDNTSNPADLDGDYTLEGAIQICKDESCDARLYDLETDALKCEIDKTGAYTWK